MKGTSIKDPLDSLFDVTMKKKWNKVEEAYKNYPWARSAKLTKSEETALHVAVSSYHSKRVSSYYENHIKGMIKSIPEDDAFKILSMKNDKGNTPLHLAATVGWLSICECIAKRNPELISTRNLKGETPLFVAAYHGKLDAFISLHDRYKQKPVQQTDQQNKGQEPDESLCRREDGNTILHSAISGEYLKLAYQIMSYYPKLVNSVNVEGESPMHVLARKANLFRSSTHFRLHDSIIYRCVFVDKLKKSPSPHKSMYSPRNGVNCPENYKTCIGIFLLFSTPIYESIRAGLEKHSKQHGGSNDEENPPKREKEPQTGLEKLSKQHGGSNDEEDPPKGEKEPQIAVKQEEEEFEDDDFFPPNYATCILFLKFSMKVFLTIIGVGFWGIRRIQVKKERHSHALQLMNEMIKSESSYKYNNNGQKPEHLEPQYSQRVPPPPIPPSTNDQQVVHLNPETNGGRSLSTDQPQNQNEKQKDESENGSVKKDTQVLVRRETPILVAAKMGILEMVQKILDTFPVAIQDMDSSGKNVLMLAAENRQTTVFDYLVEKKLPEFVFHQLDDQGNSILHLAAVLEELLPWRIPGAALQMQWEIKWYKHVKHSVPPLSFAHNNAKGETPRKIFEQTHQKLVKDGTDWLIKTSESCSVIAALIATVAFASSATVPGGLKEETGYPVLENHPAFHVFSITSLVALTLAVTALVFFLSIITSRCQERDFKLTLPRMLLLGLTSLFASIVAMLISFCAGHTFILIDKLRFAAIPIYGVACIPVAFFALMQLPLYFDLLRARLIKVPLRSYKQLMASKMKEETLIDEEFPLDGLFELTMKKKVE
ncbi:uncharacterized protein Fot_29040 [Forsythia ovata]|uniref:PGG domain-containing protein n=1 Tax=Forsythia ovata TaxID=205694 RepID=A0ABD1TQT6_9LAMI